MRIMGIRNKQVASIASLLSKIFLVLVMLILTGCERVWYLTILDVTDPAHPVFCVSSSKSCKGEGISFADSFEIAEVSEDGKEIKRPWVLKPKTSTMLKEIKYGTVPEGWVEEQKAEPLELGKIYAVRGENFFKLTRVDNKIKAEVYDLNTYLSIKWERLKKTNDQ